MRIPWISLGLAFCLPGFHAHGQSQAVLGAREIAEAAQTNLTAALALCDKAVASDSTNAQPLLWRAPFLERARRYDEGIRDLTAALKLVPVAPVTLQRRGELNFKAGHFNESVADFDRVIELAPNQAPHHWQRGISLYYAKRFEDGRKQFEQHQTVNPNDVENAAWHFLCAAREKGVTNARVIMLKAGRDDRVPMKEIEDLYRGIGSAELVLSAAQRSTKENSDAHALFYAHLYLGLYFDVLGEVTKSRGHILKASNEFGTDNYMGDVARVHLRQLR
jgi:lipoprotein NlpI